MSRSTYRLLVFLLAMCAGAAIHLLAAVASSEETMFGVPVRIVLVYFWAVLSGFLFALLAGRPAWMWPLAIGVGFGAFILVEGGVWAGWDEAWIEEIIPLIPANTAVCAGLALGGALLAWGTRLLLQRAADESEREVQRSTAVVDRLRAFRGPRLPKNPVGESPESR